MGSLAVEQPLWLLSSLKCLQTDHLRVESPPIAKKFFRSSWSQKAQQPNSLRAGVNMAFKDDVKQVDSRPNTWYAGQRRRKVSFDHNVVVVVYDRNDGAFVCCENQQLNARPKDRHQFASRTGTLFARHHSNISTSSSFDKDSKSQQCYTPTIASSGWSKDMGKPNCGPTAGRPLPSELRPLPSELTPVDNSSPPTSSTDLTFHEDNNGQLWLRLTVGLGHGVAAGDALVKANVAGNKVRVLFTRTVMTDTSASTRHDFVTRYALPMDVDPYAISARMDLDGNLFVDAPVLTGKRPRRPPSQSNL